MTDKADLLPDTLDYRGFHCKWTGWKPARTSTPANPAFYAQWFCRRDPYWFYVNAKNGGKDEALVEVKRTIDSAMDAEEAMAR